MVEVNNFQIFLLIFGNMIINIVVFNIGYVKAIYDNVQRTKEEMNKYSGIRL